jgi:hypothetical protein
VIDDLLDLVERDGRHVVLELLQLEDDVGREDVGARRRDLPELDETRAEVLQHESQALGRGCALLLCFALGEGVVGDVVGTLTGKATADNLLGMLVKPKRTFYLDNENDLAKKASEFDGIPLRIFDFPLPSRPPQGPGLASQG